MSDFRIGRRKKKIRGWPRRVRNHIEALRHLCVEPDEAFLSHFGYDTVEMGYEQAPMWVRRRYLAVLFDLYDEWYKYLKQREERTGEPFDLMLWLFHPRFHQTQLVAATGERIDHYRKLFPGAPSVADEPPEIYAGDHYDLKALDWTPGFDCEWTETWELEEWPDWGAWFERSVRGRVVERTDEVIVCRYGDVWVGRKPGGAG